MNDSRFRLVACCYCFSLKFGSIFSGICCIILAIISIVLLFVANAQVLTIVYELDETVKKIVFTINLVMTIILSILMIVGAIKRITILMLPWVLLGVILLVGLLVSIIFTAVVYFLNDKEVYHNLYGSLTLVFGIATVVIFTYFWFVVYSYFQQLRIEKNTLKIGPFGRPYSYQRP